MPVFKTYFRVMRSALIGLLLYLGIFLALSIILTVNNGPATDEQFQQTSVPLAVINRDGNSPLTEGLTSHLGLNNQLVDLPDEAEELQDALFFRSVEYIVIIPPGFAAGVLSGEDVTLQKVAVPGSTSSYYLDLQIDKYLHTYRWHQQFGQHASAAQLQAAVAHDLAQETPVQLMNESASTVTVGYIYYFSYLAYTLLAVILLGVSSIMLAFNKPDVQRRMACGPIAARSINLQLAAGHAVFALSCWAVMMLFALILYGKALLSSEILGWLTLNSLIFTIVCTSIGLLVGSLIRDHNAQGAAVNMITLGMSFICGVFVPQSILSPAVLAFAKFLPGYWYIRAHESIRDLLLSPLATRAPLLSQMLIQLGFAAAIFSVTLLLSKERRASVS